MTPSKTVDLNTQGLWVGLDSSQGQGCGVALWKGPEMVASVCLPPSAKSQSNLLPDLTSEVLKNAGVTLGQLAGIAVAAGPGSYTGLRVSVSYAKGLCLALGVPLLAVSSLALQAGAYSEFMASNPSDTIGILATIDAGRDELYAEFFQIGNDKLAEEESKGASADHSFANKYVQGILAKSHGFGKPIFTTTPDLATALEIPTTLVNPSSIVVVGNATDKLRAGQSEIPSTVKLIGAVMEHTFSEEERQLKSMDFFPALAKAALTNHGTCSIADFEPAYLKPYFFR